MKSDNSKQHVSPSTGATGSSTPPAKPSPKKALAAVGVLKHRYTLEDLQAIWDFVKHDFDSFLELLSWLETLPNVHCAEQLESAHALAKARGGESDAG